LKGENFNPSKYFPREKMKVRLYGSSSYYHLEGDLQGTELKPPTIFPY